MNRRNCLGFALITLLLLTPGAADLFGMVRDYAIRIDGSVTDWAPVRYDPENYITDLSEEQGDPDVPGSSNRDMRAFAATWDDTRMYFYFRRTFAGSNSLTLLVYMDRNHDGRMDRSDMILRFDFNGASPGPRALYSYLPAGSSDPLTGDGAAMPGTVDRQLAATMDSAATPSGIEFECSVTWASLGLAPGTPVILHPSMATGLNLPSQVYDNADNENTQYSYLDLTGNRQAAAAAGNFATFAHVLVNKGNGQDTFDINATTVNSRWLYYYSDPNGDGDPGDGVLLAVDSNGDGDFLDHDDSVTDSNGNALPDTGPLAPGQSFPFVLQFKAPAGLPNGTEEIVSVVARSSLNLNRSVLMEDLVLIGDLSIAPDQDKSSREGVSVRIPHRVYNTTPLEEVVNITAGSSLGWTVRLLADPDGDGDPADGAELADTNSDLVPDVGIVPASGCAAIVAVVDVPAASLLGTTDTVIVTASFASRPATLETATDTVGVASPVILLPDHTMNARAGESVFLSHTLQSNLETAEAFSLSSSAALGSQATFWTDPDRDGIMGDGWIATATEPVAASGGTVPLVVQIDLPSLLSIRSSEKVSLSARAASDPSVLAGALDTLNVVGCRTYANAIFSYPSDLFYRCASVFAKAGGLAPREHRFVWNDQDPTDGPERISPALTPDEITECDDRLEVGFGDMPGTWEVKLQEKSGNGWVDVPNWSYTFLVEDELSGSGAIDTLYTSDLNYEVSGESVTIVSRLFNQSDIIYFRETSIVYVIFRDANGDGIPTIGEPYVLGDGTTGAWAAGLASKTSGPVTLFPYQTYFDLFTIPSVSFLESGEWGLYCAWTTPCRTLIDERTFFFDVGCSKAPAAEAGPGASLCPGGSAVIGTPAQPRRTYRWEPAQGLSDPSAARPTAAPVATTVYTLTVTDLDTGCRSTDTVEVRVAAPPQPLLTMSASDLCAGESSALDAGPGFASYLWSTGATSRTLTVSPASTTEYCVTVTSADGCHGSTCGVVVVHPLPPADIVPAASTICRNDAVKLDAGAGHASYVWNTWETTRTITVRPQATTEYCVTVTDQAGCSSTACETITVNPLPVAEISPAAPVICLTHSVELDAGPGHASYAWSTWDTTRTITVSPTQDTTYTCGVTDANGCASEASVLVRVVVPATPADVGNTLRMTRAGVGAMFHWAAVPDVTGFRIKTAALKSFSDAAVHAEVAPSGPALTHDDPGPFAGTLAFFKVAGMNCAGAEGP